MMLFTFVPNHFIRFVRISHLVVRNALLFDFGWVFSLKIEMKYVGDREIQFCGKDV